MDWDTEVRSDAAGVRTIHRRHASVDAPDLRLPATDRLRARQPGLVQPVESVLHGWMGWAIDHRIEYVAGQPVGRGTRHLHAIRQATHWIARGFVAMAIAYIIIQREYTWVVMLLLVLFIGTDHPPTRDDTVPIGRLRYVLGCASILIPVFCFAPRLLIIPN